MIWAFLLVALAIGLIIWRFSEPDEPPKPVDPEYARKAAVDLHRIRRRLDASAVKTEQRQRAAEVRREISEAFDRDGKP